VPDQPQGKSHSYYCHAKDVIQHKQSSESRNRLAADSEGGSQAPQTCPCCGQVQHSGDEPFSCCFVHFKTERLTRRTFIVCGECGHVWTKRALRRSLRRHVWQNIRHPLYPPFDPFPNRRWLELRYYVATCLKPAKDIFFCQECIHDF
jgi:hypothetical protein